MARPEGAHPGAASGPSLRPLPQGHHNPRQGRRGGRVPLAATAPSRLLLGVTLATRLQSKSLLLEMNPQRLPNGCGQKEQRSGKSQSPVAVLRAGGAAKAARRAPPACRTGSLLPRNHAGGRGPGGAVHAAHGISRVLTEHGGPPSTGSVPRRRPAAAAQARVTPGRGAPQRGPPREGPPRGGRAGPSDPHLPRSSYVL